LTVFALKALLFKFMELGLGLKTYFSLETKDPVFVNFKLTDEEAARVRVALPPGFELQKIRFSETDSEPAYWVSYNLYQIKYPKKELQGIRRSRCEINTFVTDAKGRKGIHVFCGSPLVSKETRPSLIGRVCELAERLVIFIYGCGKLVPLVYELSDDKLRIEFDERGNRLRLRQKLGPAAAAVRLSDDYWAFNDISFFNEGKTFDLVNVNSAFTSARFESLDGAELGELAVESPFFRRAPDKVYFHRGDIPYLVDALNRC
jgi:hypothetical protein